MHGASTSVIPLQGVVDLSISTEKEKISLTKWLLYRVMPNRVDISIVPDILWRQQPKYKVKHSSNYP
ncbi:tail fiber assembly protein [Xenorhabdus bovienii]|nr:tail fiber assembly protein [Xenorhabdus bovienii]MDE9497145.1 tail fiber assembly protein [Xenorhabdus bovienii]